MRVSGDIFNNVICEPDYLELRAILRVFSGLLLPDGNAYTLKSYASVPQFLVKDSIYWEYTALKTRSFSNQQQLLTGVKRCVDMGTGDILDCSKGIVLGGGFRYTVNELGFTANHIPQLFALNPASENRFNVVTGFIGDYSFQTKLFRGQITFKDYREIWND